MKKSKLLFVNLLSCVILLIAVAFFSTPVYAFAQNNNIDNVSVNEQTTNTNVCQMQEVQDIQDFFKDKKIALCDYLFNLDDSADYIYVEFEGGGYAVFANESLEMMEYSLQGSLPYNSFLNKKYYAGPNLYLQKSGNQFFDVVTGNQLKISDFEVVNFSKNVREALIKESDYNNAINFSTEELSNKISCLNTNNSAPNIDKENYITLTNITGTKIRNYSYFLLNPKHGDNYIGETYGNNNYGTCGPVAAQLLLSYNNYYNDRRIIEDKYLNGYDDATNTVADKEKNPNYCADPMSMTQWTTGTRSEATGENSFYSKIITTIMEPNTHGASNKQVCNGIKSYLNERLSASEFSVNYEEKGWLFGYSNIDPSIIKAEIDSGRPLIISMDSNLGGTDHDVLGYGYQDYTYPDGEGTYSGYIVHLGYQREGTFCTWINASWCDGYISLKMNHTHQYTYDLGYSVNLCKKMTRCVGCGHRTDTVVELCGGEKLTELVSDLSQSGGYKDYYVTFLVAGSKLIQTFGREDVKISLYDENNNLLVYDDNSGYELNAFIRINAEIDKKYRLRVEYSGASNSGKVKTVISPTNVLYQWYDKWIYSGAEHSHYSYVFKNQNDGFVYNPPENGTYTIRTVWKEENAEESVREPYIHIIDPISTEKSLSDCLSGGNRQALITAQLVKGRLYFIVISSCNIVNDEGGITTLIQKIS